MNMYEYVSFVFGTTKDPSFQTCFSLRSQAFLERAAGKALTLAKALKLNEGSEADEPNVLRPPIMSWDAQGGANL